MLKLVLIGYGSDEETVRYVSVLQNEISDFIKQSNMHLYNLKNLWKAEALPDLLKRNSRLTFSSEKSTYSDYWGVAGVEDCMELYPRWFSSCPHDDTYQPALQYSVSNMASLIKKWSTYRKASGNSELYDLEISYNYEKMPGNKSKCTVELSLNNSDFYPKPIEIFQSILVKLDALSDGVLTSAYVTDEPAVPGAALPHYFDDYELLENKVLDVGYAFYFCRRIGELNDVNETGDLKQYSVKKLKNGTLYVFNGAPEDYNYCSACSDIPFLGKIKIPSYRFLDWPSLCRKKEVPFSSDGIVSVCYPQFPPYTRDPEIFFSSGYTLDKLEKMYAERTVSCFARYKITDILSSL